jgi:DNA-binding NarL/FixJ family response regulator
MLRPFFSGFIVTVVDGPIHIEMKILIVDDNAAMREMVRSFLPASFDEICECADGSEALDRYRSFSPDWVLMDWEMKPVDGLVAIRQILIDFPDAKILLVTQHDDPELLTAAFDAGVKGFVLKDDLPALRRLLLPR